LFDLIVFFILILILILNVILNSMFVFYIVFLFIFMCVLQDVGACLPLLNDGSTARVARVLARGTVAPLDSAMKDACPYVFNSARHSWAVNTNKKEQTTHN
jgi:ribosome modulation factor